MSFKRRHYEELAAALKAAKPPYADWPRTTQHVIDCTAVADVLQRVNSGFNRERFLRDCGVQS